MHSSRWLEADVCTMPLQGTKGRGGTRRKWSHEWSPCDSEAARGLEVKPGAVRVYPCFVHPRAEKEVDDRHELGAVGRLAQRPGSCSARHLLADGVTGEQWTISWIGDGQEMICRSPVFYLSPVFCLSPTFCHLSYCYRTQGTIDCIPTTGCRCRCYTKDSIDPMPRVYLWSVVAVKRGISWLHE